MTKARISDLEIALGAVRAALKTEEAFQQYVEAGSFSLEVVLSVTAPVAADGTNRNHRLNVSLAEVIKPRIRDFLDLAGDNLRTRERELGDRIVRAAELLARGDLPDA